MDFVISVDERNISFFLGLIIFCRSIDYTGIIPQNTLTKRCIVFALISIRLIPWIHEAIVGLCLEGNEELNRIPLELFIKMSEIENKTKLNYDSRIVNSQLSALIPEMAWRRHCACGCTSRGLKGHKHGFFW